MFCCVFSISTFFRYCHQQQNQQNGSGKTELSLNTAEGGGGGPGIKVTRKTKTRFEGYARNMTGPPVGSKEAGEEGLVVDHDHCFP